MAAEYEVNISLNTKKIDRQLGTLEKRLSNLSKTADPLGGSPERIKNLDRIRATGVIINRLGRELNKLEAQGVKVQNERSRIKRAVAKLDKGLVETARAHVVELRSFVRESKKGLKAKEKTVKLDSVQNKFSERRLRALARSNERNQKDLRLNQKMTAEARARMRLLTQSGAQAFISANPPAQGRQLADDIDARLKAQERSARLANRINELEAKGVNVSKHRKQLGKIRTAQADGLFGLAAREVRVLKKSLELEQSKLRILKEQSKFLAGGPMRFPSGRRVTNPFDVGPARPLTQAAPSSFVGEKQLQDIATFEKKQQRAALNAHMRQLGFIQKQTKARIAANEKLLQDDRKRLADFDRDFAKSIADRQKMLQGVAKAGVKPDSVFGPLRQLGQASMVAGANEAKLLAGRFRAPSSPLTARPVTRASADQAAKQVEDDVRRRTALEKRAADQAAAYRRRVDRQVLRAKLRLDEIDFKNKIDDIEKLAQRQIKEGEKAGKEFDRELKRREKAAERLQRMRRKARNRRIGDTALGAGFPLLFGGGAGSVVGGALGGALGGGLAAQIALSAVGQQIDQFVAGMVDAGKALTSVGGAADFMAEKSLFSSDQMQFRIEKLIEEGQVTEAAALMTQEMAKQVGGSGLKALKDLGTEASKMGKIFGTLLLRVQAFIAQALTPLIKIINRAIGGLTAQNQLDQMIAEAGSSERGAEILARSRELRGVKRNARTGKAMGLNALTPEVIQTLQEEYPAFIPKGAAIEPTELEKLRSADKGSDKAAKDAERLAKRLAGLDAERNKLEQLLKLDQQINSAKLEDNNRQVIVLENEARMLQFAEKEAVIRASKVPQEQKIAELKNLSLEKDRALLENAFRLDSFDKEKADDFAVQLKQLDLQLEAATALTREAENQAKLELLLLNLRESNKTLTDDQLEQLMNKTKELFKAQNKGPLQSFIDQSVKSLNDLEQHAVQVSQGIGNAIGNSLVSGLQNLVTGAESVKEVFANMLKAVADVLAQQAAQMIATYISIGVARLFAGIGGAYGSGAEKPLTSGMDYSGAFASGGFGISAAEGAYVAGPTKALVGEGGESEYIIPESKMRESMARYSRGARGSSVIPDSGVSGTSGEGGGTAVAAPIDVRYTVERINSIDYVTVDQFQRGMQQAAAQGASQGEQRALTTLRQNTSQRRRIGL